MFVLLRWLGGQLDNLLWFARVGGVVLIKVKYQEGFLHEAEGWDLELYREY